MKIIVDTSVWSLALRKKTLTDSEKKIVKELRELIFEFRVVTMGSIRQELLSGISSETKFKNLRDKLKSFDDLDLDQKDYEKAAEISNICRRSGIQGSHIDFLICAAAVNRQISIFTTDKDFENYSNVINLKLHSVRSEIG